MAVAQIIREKLEAAFLPQELAVSDESARHAGHAGAAPGGQTHFAVRIVSARFAGMGRVERQQRVYAILADEFQGGVHALSLKALTPQEAARQGA